MATKFHTLPQPLPVLDLLPIVLEIALVLAKRLVDSVCKNPCLNWTKTHQDMGPATSPTSTEALHEPTSTMVSAPDDPWSAPSPTTCSNEKAPGASGRSLSDNLQKNQSQTTEDKPSTKRLDPMAPAFIPSSSCYSIASFMVP